MSENRNSEIIYKGIAASPGVSHGPALLLLPKELDIPSYQISDDEIVREISRFEEGIVRTRQQISAIRSQIAEKLGEEEALIFDAHLLVLEDKALIEETIREMQECHNNLEYCFHEVCSRYIDAFLQLDDDYFKERVTDIRDVSRRLLKNLLGDPVESFTRLAESKILVAKDLTPSETAGLDRDQILGLLTDAGSKTSHAVIMARSIGVPAVVGMHDITQKLSNNDDLIIDGYDGVVIVNPSDDSLFRYGKLHREKQQLKRVFDSYLHLPGQTRDGTVVRLRANVEGNESIDDLKNNGVEGVGLFRTEGLFLRGDKFPTEEEQFQAYKRIVEGLNPRTVIIRTLDLGGDKIPQSKYFSYKEDNPFMGFRAIRYCLEHRDIFKDQLRAILRANAFGNAKVMYPMISGVGEFLAANEVLEEAKEELKERGVEHDPNLPVGSMIELPSAALVSDLLAKYCDFFSIGTNDLIQYLLAVDRVNDRIAHLYNPGHSAVIRVLKMIFDAGRHQGIPVGVCGEMASDPMFVPLLLGLGATELSMIPSLLPEVKYLVNNLDMKDAVSLSEEIAVLDHSSEIMNRLRNFYAERMSGTLQ